MSKLPSDPLYSHIRQIIIQARKQVINHVNQSMTMTYFEIGKMIVEHEQKGEHKAAYGKRIIKNLSKKLLKEFGKGFSVSNLEYMRQFYLTYNDRISQTVSGKLKSPPFKLSWSHYLFLMRLQPIELRQFYEIEASLNHWSLRELKRQYNSSLYERLALSRDKHFWIDLVFYNRILQCFLLIDLKRGELTHEDLGQLQMYVNYYDRELKLPHENKTIGLIICQSKEDAIIKYTLPEDNTQIYASKYQMVLPDKESIMKLLKQPKIHQTEEKD